MDEDDAVSDEVMDDDDNVLDADTLAESHDLHGLFDNRDDEEQIREPSTHGCRQEKLVLCTVVYGCTRPQADFPREHVILRSHKRGKKKRAQKLRKLAKKASASTSTSVPVFGDPQDADV